MKNQTKGVVILLIAIPIIVISCSRFKFNYVEGKELEASWQFPKWMDSPIIDIGSGE